MNMGKKRTVAFLLAFALIFSNAARAEAVNTASISNNAVEDNALWEEETVSGNTIGGEEEESEGIVDEREDTASNNTAEGEKETVSGNTAEKGEETISDNTVEREEETVSGNTAEKEEETISDNTVEREEETVSGNTAEKEEETVSDNTTGREEETISGNTAEREEGTVSDNHFFSKGAASSSLQSDNAGQREGNVWLYSAAEEEGDYTYISGFATLQEALTEIEIRADKSQFYRIELVTAQEDVVTFKDKALIFPAQTAGLIITGAATLTDVKLYMNGSLLLKSNTSFEDITFIPTAQSRISIGNFRLTLTGCQVQKAIPGTGFTQLSGSGGTKASQLILENTALEIDGAVQKIGKLTFSQDGASSLKAAGAISLGDVELLADGKITAAASVSRKNGEVTRVTPQITIRGEVVSAGGELLSLDLQEKRGTVWQQLDFDAREMENMKSMGIPMVKAPLVTSANLVAEQSAGVKLVKSGGYLCWIEGGPAVTLSFSEEGVSREISCISFMDAVTEINNRKTRQEYTITLLAGITERSAKNPKAMTMPNKKYIQSLTIQADPRLDSEAIQFSYLGNITLTCDVFLRDVHFVQQLKTGNGYESADMAKDDHPAAVTLNTGGCRLDLEGNITFNTPLILKGGKRGSLVIHESARLNTRTNDYVENPEGTDSTIYGSLTAFGLVEIKDCTLNLREYRTTRTAKKYIASNNQITVLTLNRSILKLFGKQAKASLKVNDLSMDNAELLVGGKLNLVNATLEGTQKALIFADQDFTISGTLTSLSDNATLKTRLRGAKKAPYLNIKGKVVRGADVYPVYVGVYPEITAEETIRDEAVKLNSPNATGQLLTAKQAAAGDFRPIPENYAGGEYSWENTGGYMMQKVGSNIYVHEGGNVKLAVYKGNALVGYYFSFREATAAVNALKDKSAEYVYLLTDQNGSAGKPVTITLPVQAARVVIKPAAENLKGIYFSSTISLGCETAFEGIRFFPVNKGKGAAFSLSTNGHNLELTDTSVGKTLPGMRLKNIVGKKSTRVTVSAKDMVITGSLTGVKTLQIKEDFTILGNLQAEELVLNNGADGQAVTVRADGSIKLNKLVNYGSKQNVLQFTRTAKNTVQLTINDKIENPDGTLVVLEQITENQIGSSQDYTLNNIADKGTRTKLTAAKRLANLPKAATDSFVFRIRDSLLMEETGNGGEVSLLASGLVKADKGLFYIGDASDPQNKLAAHRVVMTDAWSVTGCLDYTQAINEINLRKDQGAEYSLKFISEGGTEGQLDTNLTDSYLYGNLPFPKANTKARLTLSGQDASKTVLSFSGGIKAYGITEMENLTLNPVKGKNDGSGVDVKITLAGDRTASQLVLNNVSAGEGSTGKGGSIASIGGQASRTAVTVKNGSRVRIKGGITNVNQIHLEESQVLTKGNSAVSTLLLAQGGHWDSMGQLTIKDIQVLTESETSWLGVGQNEKGQPLLKINGIVEGNTLLCKLYSYGETRPVEISSYRDVPLALAPVADAKAFRAYPYRKQVLDSGAAIDGITKDNLIAYKELNYVKNGSMEDRK